MIKVMRPFINDDASMFLHAREGGVAVFSFTEEDGTPRDMTEATVTFETQGFVKSLTLGEEPNQMVLKLNASELPITTLNKSRDYIILDSSGELPHVICDGKLTVTGWT